VALEAAGARQGEAPVELPAPDWVSDVRRKYRLRITDWVTQAWAMTVAPHRFMAEWATGRREALNPLRYLAVGTAVKFLAERGARWVMHLESSEKTWVSWLRSSFGVTVTLILFGLMMHVVLRLRSRAPVRSTVAAIIFSSAGPGVFGHVLAWLVSIAIYLVGHRVPCYAPQGTPPYPYPVLGITYFGYLWLTAALSGVHRVRWWWALAALLAIPVGMAVVGITVGTLVALERQYLNR
jgi:hypothetical protein